MATTVTFNGTSYSIPANREPRGWGTSLSSFLVDVANSSLSKAGGSFTLTADANFGSNYGLVVKYIKSVSSNIAASGVVRLANTDKIAFRNNANGADLSLGVSASDRLQFESVNIPTISSTDALTNKTIVVASNTVTTAASGNLAATELNAALAELQTDIDTRATTAGKLSQFAATTSAELAGVISDETGSGSLVFATSPSLTTPSLGAATATSINSTTIPTSKTLVVTTDKLSVHAATTSAELAGVISDETGSGALVFGTSPTIASPSIGSPTFSDYTLFTETSAPSTPASGKVAIYAKSDKKLYKKDSNGTESELGAGGTSLINYISNPDFETGATTGWATYKDSSATPTDGTGGSPTTLTLSANSSSPMRGSYDFKVAKSAANSQGEGFSYDFTIKTPDKSKKLSISFDLNSSDSNYTAGDVVVYVYDVTNATLITPSTTSLPKVGASTWNITFDSTTSTSYRLIFHWAVTTATAVNLYFDSFIVGPGTITQGAAVTYIGRDTSLTTGGFGTNSSVSVDYWRIGNLLKAKGKFTAGTVQAATATITLRDSLTTDVGATKIVGRWWRDNSSATTRKTGTLYCTDGSTTLLFANDDYTTAVGPVSAINGDTVTSNSNVTYFEYEVPVSAWAGNGTVNLGAGAQVEYAATSGTWDAASSTTVYGSAGQLMGGALTAGRAKTVTWQSPIQADDMIIVEASVNGTTWWPLNNSRIGSAGGTFVIPAFDSTGTEASGVFLRNTSSTQTEVFFGRYSSIANDDAPLGAWPSDTYWRARKAKASSPVGFGLAGTDGSSGLYKAGSAPGLTTGAAVATGYVGQVVTSSGSSVTAGTTSQYKDCTSITLTAGHWLVSGGLVWNYNGASSADTAIVAISGYTANTTTDHTTGFNVFQFRAPASTDTNSSGTIPNLLVRSDGTNLYIGGFTISSSQVLYLKGRITYTGTTPAMSGTVTAFRIA